MFDAEKAEFLSISNFLKATPFEDGQDRFVYFEASNEARDFQGETVLAKALADSADYYLRYGNVDIDHVTLTGAKNGIPDYNLFEIGRPTDVRLSNPRTFVKAQIYRGDGPVAEKANNVWDSLTKLSPPGRWYPSVAGQIIGRYVDVDPQTKMPRNLITKVRWLNVGLSRTPVNPEVPTVSTVPMDVLAKCWGVAGLDMTRAMRKGLEAGYGTDSATMTGGAALRTQSLDHRLQSYWDFRDAMSGALRKGLCGRSAADMVEHAAAEYGLQKSLGADWAGRFIADLRAAHNKGISK